MTKENHTVPNVSQAPMPDAETAAVLSQLTDETALLAYARMRAAAGDTTAAEAVCRTCLERRPDSREALLALGTLYEQTRRLAEALKLYDGAIAAAPDFAEAYRQRGAVKFRLNDRLGAFDDLKKALALRPDLGEAFDGLLSSGRH